MVKPINDIPTQIKYLNISFIATGWPGFNLAIAENTFSSTMVLTTKK